MRNFTTILLVALLLCGTLAVDALAQKGAGRQQGVARQADKPDLETITGTVAEIKIGPCEATTGHGLVGVHVLLKSDDGTTHNVHLGPQGDLTDVINDIEVGQPLTVTGFRTSELADDALVAKTLKTDQQTIELRSDSLQPVWAAGAGRGRGPGAQAAAGRQGRGRGAGPGMGQAMGQGRGQGMGRGMGQGRGQAMGNAVGQGKGMGKAMGQGCGQGCGCGAGAQCGQGRGRGPGNGLAMQGNGFRGGRGPGFGPAWADNSDQRATCARQMTASLEATPAGEVSPDEIAGLVQMREEEKLAHDVYVTLGKKWDLPPLANIPWAESQHMKLVKMLLDRYGLEDPITDTTVGVFQTNDMQQLYDKLIAQGEQSIVEAIKVGALIEELDIADLRRLVDETDNEDLRAVYDNLLLGSRNHLRAFARQLQRYGATYEAIHLSQEEFDQIAASDHERCMAPTP